MPLHVQPASSDMLHVAALQRRSESPAAPTAENPGDCGATDEGQQCCQGGGNSATVGSRNMASRVIRTNRNASMRSPGIICGDTVFPCIFVEDEIAPECTQWVCLGCGTVRNDSLYAETAPRLRSQIPDQSLPDALSNACALEIHRRSPVAPTVAFSCAFVSHLVRAP